MNQYINIQPKSIFLEGTKITIGVLSLQLNLNAIIKVELYDDTNKILDTVQFVLTGDEYKQWQDDSYLVQYVCNKYGYLTK
jgi:hypothetical protein